MGILGHIRFYRHGRRSEAILMDDLTWVCPDHNFRADLDRQFGAALDPDSPDGAAQIAAVLAAWDAELLTG